MKPQHDRKIEALKAAWWERTGGDDPFRGKTVVEFFEDARRENPSIFREPQGKLPAGCVDERLDGDIGWRIAWPGSVGLERNSVLESGLAEWASEITQHRDCGAAALLAKKAQDKSALETLARKIATANKIPFRESPIAVDADFHYARAAFITFTPKFDEAEMKKTRPHLPGFLLSAYLVPEETQLILDAVKLIINIATGEDGYGRITSESPFYLIVLAEGEKELARRIRQLEPLESDYGNRVRIVGYDVSRKAA